MDEGPRRRRDRSADAGFVSLLQAGDPNAFGMLVDTWTDPVYDRLSHLGFTTADALDLSVATFTAVHRHFSGTGDAGPAVEPFGVVVTRVARQQAAVAEERRVDLFLAVGPYAGDRLAHGTDVGTLAKEEPVATLLWETAGLLGESGREVLDLHLRGDFEVTEIAAIVGLPVGAVADLILSTPDAFRELVGIQLVWRQGSPACSDLAAALVRHNQLEAQTRRAIVEHLVGCARCRAAASPQTDPVAVLAAIPVGMAPAGFKPALIEVLARIGLPVSGSVAHRLPAAASALPAADPRLPPQPYPNYVATADHTVRYGPGAEPAPSIESSRFAGPTHVDRRASGGGEPELPALVLDDPRWSRGSRTGRHAEPEPLAADDGSYTPRHAEPVAQHAASDPAVDDEWVDEWLAEGVAEATRRGSLLAPPPSPEDPTPIVPPLNRDADPGSSPRRRRWRS
jgi:hypothetical protein